MHTCVGHLACTVTAQDLRARFALYGVVDRITLLTDRETGHPPGLGYVAMADDAVFRRAGAIEGEEHAR